MLQGCAEPQQQAASPRRNTAPRPRVLLPSAGTPPLTRAGLRGWCSSAHFPSTSGTLDALRWRCVRRPHSRARRRDRPRAPQSARSGAGTAGRAGHPGRHRKQWRLGRGHAHIRGQRRPADLLHQRHRNAGASDDHHPRQRAGCWSSPPRAAQRDRRSPARTGAAVRSTIWSADGSGPADRRLSGCRRFATANLHHWAAHRDAQDPLG